MTSQNVQLPKVNLFYLKMSWMNKNLHRHVEHLLIAMKKLGMESTYILKKLSNIMALTASLDGLSDALVSWKDLVLAVLLLLCCCHVKGGQRSQWLETIILICYWILMQKLPNTK